MTLNTSRARVTPASAALASQSRASPSSGGSHWAASRAPRLYWAPVWPAFAAAVYQRRASRSSGGSSRVASRIPRLYWAPGPRWSGPPRTRPARPHFDHAGPRSRLALTATRLTWPEMPATMGYRPAGRPSGPRPPRPSTAAAPGERVAHAGYEQQDAGCCPHRAPAAVRGERDQTDRACRRRTRHAWLGTRQQQEPDRAQGPPQGGHRPRTPTQRGRTTRNATTRSGWCRKCSVGGLGGSSAVCAGQMPAERPQRPISCSPGGPRSAGRKRTRSRASLMRRSSGLTWAKTCNVTVRRQRGGQYGAASPLDAAP